MTHGTRFSLRLQNYAQVLKAAVLYDFIPLDWPGYLPTTAHRIEYSAKLARLRKFDLFFPISAYTAWRLRELVGVSGSRVQVTGACVRNSLYEARLHSASRLSPYEKAEPYFVTLGGDDRRKNTDVAVRAVRHLNLLYGRRIPLKVIGFYCDAYKHDLLRIAGHAEGAGFLEFYPSIPDSEVVQLHLGAVAAVCPSRIEGFSLPVAEAAVCGCPVISSTCAAQIELVNQEEALFHSEDHAGLAEKLEALLNQPALRSSLVAAQAHLAHDYHANEVGKRFWSALGEAAESRRLAVSHSQPRRPRIAFLSPYPPDPAPAAFYTAGLMQSGEKTFASELFSDTPRPLDAQGQFRDAGVVSLAPLLDRSFNSVVAVLGSTPGQSRVLEFFEHHGGPCILHDVRLLHAYFELLGPAGFCELAGKLQGRPIALAEAHAWLQDPNCTLLFLEKVVARASPLIVQTPTQRALIKKAYGVDAHVTTCCPRLHFEAHELETAARKEVREQLGLASSAFIVSTFGKVARSNGMDVCILAVELLRSWNIPAELYFVGDASPLTSEIDRVAEMYGVSQFVHCAPEFADDEAYRNFLIASDAALQLRDYAFGQVSSELLDCIAAGLPAVTTNDTSKSCEAPDYVKAVPDRFSPLQVAEELALIWETPADRPVGEELRTAYLQKHNFDYYAGRLLEILGLQ